uniref:Pappalysin-1 SD scarf domain-containing protein n=1 Tax=Petromyzon marinus TaxID=7757 RepID=S4R8X7_PETMA
CQETTPSLEKGDLCADTAPTPQNKLCHDPEPRNDTCNQRYFQHTPFNNYMSYADDGCTNSFTPNQVARMHCYLDLVYEGWRLDRAPLPVPMPPTPAAHDEGSLTLQWMPPINGHVFQREVGSACDLCGEDGRLTQFAHSASSPRACDPSGHWSPKEAEG